MKKFTEPNARPQIVRKGKKSRTPLSRLRMSDAVKVVSDFPSRLEELFRMLEDRDRHIRGRAAATLAQFVSLHPSRLLRFVPRLREALLDESAYVRWYLVHTLGTLCELFPKRLQNVLPDLLACLEDQNTIVRRFASKALARVALRDPVIVEELFRNTGKEIPRIVNDVLRGPGSKA